MRYLMLFLMLAGLCLADVNHDNMPIVNPGRLATAASTTEDMNAANDLFGATFCATQTAITGVNVYVSAVAGTEGNRKLTVYITALDAAGSPDEGAPLANGTKEITAATIVVGKNAVAFATPPTTVVGTFYGVIVKNTAVDPTTDKFTIYYRGTNAARSLFPFSVSCTDGGTTWTRSNNMPSVCPYYSDGSMPKGFYPGFAATIAVASDHTPDEYASVFTVANPTTCDGCIITYNVVANTDLVVKLIEDTTTIYTVTVDDTNAGDNTNLNFVFVPWPAYTLHSGHTYYISIYNSTTTHSSLTCANQFYASADKVFAMGSVLYGAVRTDAGAWTEYNSGTDYRVYPIIPSFGVETISGAGGAFFRGYGG